jgi:hypothetical protein
MITLTTQIQITNDIPKINKWQVADAHDYATQAPPYLILTLLLFGPGAVVFGSYNLLIYDAIASTVLTVNPSPQQISDQFLYTNIILAGTPYTTLAALWNGATTPATHAGRLKAIEAALVGAGILPAAFAGT